MSVGCAEPALVREAAVGPRDDPLVALLEAAYRRLAPAPGTDKDPAGLIVAGDGSRIGQTRIFERSAEIGRALPPRFIPHRLSNGAASQLAIRFQHTGRVLTLADGPASVFRALAFTVASLEASVGPPRWILLSGNVEDFGPERVTGAAVAIEFRRDLPQPFGTFRSGAVPPRTAASDSISLVLSLASLREWQSEIAFRDPERTGGADLGILGTRA
ncbi:MAG: hypothetical protein ACRD16_07200 [Thermoanaerobaculia bacterium]